MGIQKALSSVVTLNVPWRWKSRGHHNALVVDDDIDDDASNDSEDADNYDATAKGVNSYQQE